MAASWRNRVRQFLRRLRQPRYAIGLLFGIAYFFFAFGGPLLMRNARHPMHTAPTSEGVSHLVGYLVAPILAIITAAYWILGGSMRAIAMTPAEANFLVPAPITRRRILQYKLLVGQPGILFSAVFMTLILRASPLPLPLRFISVWLVVSTLQLHQIGASLVHAGLKEQGRAAWRRVWPVTLLFGVALSIIAVAWFRAGIAIRAAPTSHDMYIALDAVFHRAPVNIVLAPYAAVIAPAMARTFSGWLSAFAIGLLILAAHYYWVMRSDTAYEEGAIEFGARYAAALESMRTGKQLPISTRKPRVLRAPWFALPSNGDPVFAVWWKNVLHFTRGFSWTIVFLILLLPVAIAALEYSDSHSLLKSLVPGAAVLLMFGVMSVFMGPMMVKNDLRMDLRRIELMRTLPVGGPSLVATEIAAGAFTLIGAQLILFGIGGVFMVAPALKHTKLVLELAIPVILLVIAFDFMFLVVHNGFALFFPAWSKSNMVQGAGIEVLGQRIMTMMGGLLVFVIAVFAAAIGAAAVAAATYAQWKNLAFIPAGIVFLGVLYIEIVLGVVWLGHAYDRIDPVTAGLCQ